MNNKISIGILYYLKEDSYIQSDTYIPIQLGYNETGVDMGIIKDNVGENRSDRHPIYSEYSGIYWMWKNSSSPYKGVFQHRRSLSRENTPPLVLLSFFSKLVKTWVKNLGGIYSRSEWNAVIKCERHQLYVSEVEKTAEYLSELFDNGYDIIVPRPFHFINSTVYEQFDEVVSRILIKAIDSILKADYAQYYGLFRSSLYDTQMYYANISVMKGDLYDEYCEFVFGIFDSLEQILIKEKYYVNLYKERSLYRIFGYIGELLTNVYILKKAKEGYKIKELCLLYDCSVKGNEDTDYTKIKL